MWQSFSKTQLLIVGRWWYSLSFLEFFNEWISPLANRYQNYYTNEINFVWHIFFMHIISYFFKWKFYLNFLSQEVALVVYIKSMNAQIYSSYNDSLVCLIVTVATVLSLSFFFLFLFLFFQSVYTFFYITNSTIFSQLLRCQFFIDRNKIIKYETVTNYNWK